MSLSSALAPTRSSAAVIRSSVARYSLPKYTGTNKINPIAAINAMAMLLEHSGQPQSAARIDNAVASVTGTKMKSQAAGRMGFGTSEVGDLVVAALES